MPAVFIFRYRSADVPAIVTDGFGAAPGNGKLAWINPSKVQRGASIVPGVFSLSMAWAAFH
ncbi:hypothetical protein R69919_02842 [Paraburkholderia gardini]|nr:hypothetical protein R69919_02842 [Paraburkholderia gardini]